MPVVLLDHPMSSRETGSPTCTTGPQARLSQVMAIPPCPALTSSSPGPRPAPLSRIYGHEPGLQPMAGTPPGVAAFQTYPTLFLSTGRCLAPTSTPGRRA